MRRGPVILLEGDEMLPICPRCGWRHPEPEVRCPFEGYTKRNPHGVTSVGQAVFDCCYSVSTEATPATTLPLK